jgi:hypothetical protein
MTYETMQYQPSKRQRLLRPAFALAAVFATAATLGLTVIAPSLAAAEPQVPTYLVSAQAAPAPVEVSILPGTIEVVASRTKVAKAGKTARTTSPYLPATYRTRG